MSLVSYVEIYKNLKITVAYKVAKHPEIVCINI